MWDKGGYLFDGGGGEPLWLRRQGRRAMAAEAVLYITINFHSIQSMMTTIDDDDDDVQRR